MDLYGLMLNSVLCTLSWALTNFKPFCAYALAAYPLNDPLPIPSNILVLYWSMKLTTYFYSHSFLAPLSTI